MLICNQIVVNNAEGKVFYDIDSIKYNKVGLLLGTTPQARIGRITNAFFTYRIDAAEQLYKARKIEKILVSGDENSLDGVNETKCMRDSLVARGILAKDIILDCDIKKKKPNDYMLEILTHLLDNTERI